MTTRRQKRVRFAKRFALSLFGAIAATLIIAYYTGWLSPIEAEARRIRAQGLPASLVELEDWYPAVPEEENAAPELMRLLLDDKPGSVRDLLPKTGYTVRVNGGVFNARNEYDKMVTKHASAAYTESRELLDEAHTILQPPSAHFSSFSENPGEWANLNAQCFIKLSNLQRDAGFFYLRSGNGPKAFERLDDLLRLANFLRFYPDYQGGVRIGVISFATDLMSDFLDSGAFTEAELKSLDERLRLQLDNELGFRRLVAWRCYYLDLQRTQTGNPFQRAQKTQNVTRVLDYTERVIAASRLPLEIGSTSDESLSSSEVAVARSDVPSLDRVARTNQILWSMSRELAMWPFKFDPYTEAKETIPYALGSNTCFKEATCIAYIDLMRAGIAIERYRLAQNVLPPQLSALIPDYLESVESSLKRANVIDYTAQGNTYKLKLQLRLYYWPDVSLYRVSAPFVDPFDASAPGAFINTAKVFCVPRYSFFDPDDMRGYFSE